MTVAPTVDPDVVIEENVIDASLIDPVSGEMGARVITYRSTFAGRRWKVIGNCDRRGDCLVGSFLGRLIRSKADLANPSVLESGADTPVTPEFDSCCPFSYEELDAV